MRLERELEKIRLHIADATPMVLMLNELVTNALKHAFPEQAGTIRIVLRRHSSDRIELRIIDDGVGMTDEQTPRTGRSIVSALVQQMNGTLTRECDGGTVWILQFPPTDLESAQRIGRAAT